MAIESHDSVQSTISSTILSSAPVSGWAYTSERQAAIVQKNYMFAAKDFGMLCEIVTEAASQWLSLSADSGDSDSHIT